MRGRILRFLLVGSFTFIVYFLLQNALVRVRFGPLEALSIAYLVSIMFHYISNALFTFKNNLLHALTPARLIQYASVNFGNYLINLMCGKISLMLELPVQVGMVVGVAITTLTGFFFYDRYIFKRGENDPFT